MAAGGVAPSSRPRTARAVPAVNERAAHGKIESLRARLEPAAVERASPASSPARPQAGHVQASWLTPSRKRSMLTRPSEAASSVFAQPAVARPWRPVSSRQRSTASASASACRRSSSGAISSSSSAGRACASAGVQPTTAEPAPHGREHPRIRPTFARGRRPRFAPRRRCGGTRARAPPPPRAGARARARRRDVGCSPANVRPWSCRRGCSSKRSATGTRRVPCSR